MTTATTDIPGPGSFTGGVHPDQAKVFSADMPIKPFPPPTQVSLPVLQHVGAPCTPVEGMTKAKKQVALGDVVAASDAFISAPIHASISGVTAAGGVTTLPNGRHVRTIVINAGDQEQLVGEPLMDDVLGGEWPTKDIDSLPPAKIASAVHDAGIVGLGGAAFPTHVKLTRNDAKPIDTLLINGCECEPYLTADYRLMLEFPAPIIAGALLAGRAAGADDVIIAVEDNKPMAVDVLERAARGTTVKVVSVHTKYPMGGEKQTIRAVLDRTVPTGGLPLDIGVVVVNVGTAAAIARAALRGKPLTHRVITVTGAGIVSPRNLLAPIGISYGDLIEHCGGLTGSAVRVIAGGPMMGFALADLSTPVTKGTSGVVMLTADDLYAAEETQCVRCGACVDACPLDLVPTKIALAARHKDWPLARRYHMAACMDCGCCAYVCPARIPLVQLIRMGKVQMARE